MPANTPETANPFDGAELAPDTGGEYRGYRIRYNPPPIPDRRFDWEFCHKDYGGEGDSRYGHAASPAEARAEIDEIEAERDAAEAFEWTCSWSLAGCWLVRTGPFGNHLTFPRDEEAKARLIAAAPKLLEAVKRARRHAENIGLDVAGSSYVQTLDAAIAKAEAA